MRDRLRDQVQSHDEDVAHAARLVSSARPPEASDVRKARVRAKVMARLDQSSRRRFLVPRPAFALLLLLLTSAAAASVTWVVVSWVRSEEKAPEHRPPEPEEVAPRPRTRSRGMLLPRTPNPAMPVAPQTGEDGAEPDAPAPRIADLRAPPHVKRVVRRRAVAKRAPRRRRLAALPSLPAAPDPALVENPGSEPEPEAAAPAPAPEPSAPALAPVAPLAAKPTPREEPAAVAEPLPNPEVEAREEKEPSAEPAGPAPRPEVQALRPVPDEEVRLAKAAFDALRRRRDARSALALVLKYRRRYPRGTFSEEALGVGIEAAASLGEAVAGRLARQYLKAYPGGRFRAAAARAAARFAP